MEKLYSMTLSERELRQACDMLRYDGAYEVQSLGEGRYRIYTTQFTPARWRSFGVSPDPLILSATRKEWEEKSSRAFGFTDGIRFAQRFLKGLPLVEG